jgi:tetratricopeptide (TPR) repeat protein
VKTAKMISKAAVLALLVFTGLFTACQSTGSNQSTDDSQSTGGSQRNREAVLAFERGEALYRANALEEAIREFSRAIELEPEWAEVYLARGNARVWGLNADFDLGQEDYDRAAALDPKYRDYAQAVRANNDGDYTRALELFNRVIQNGINLMDAYSYRGNLYSAIGDNGKAIADHTEAININPEFCGNYSNRAYIYNLLGQYDMAIADCNRALVQSPDYFYAYIFRGEAYILKENTNQAMADVNRAIQINPDNRGNLPYYPYWLRGVIHEQKENYPGAIADYSQVLQLFPKFVNAYIERGYCYAMLRDYNKAMDDINAALRLDPGNEAALYWREQIRAAQRR